MELLVYENVKNTRELQQNLNEVALVDASLIVSKRHALSALEQAERRARSSDVVVRANDAMKTRNLHTEFMYCLAPTTSIGDALRMYGATSETTSLLVTAAVEVDGDQRSLDFLDTQDNATKVADLFKLTAAERRDVENAVLTRLAVKDLI